MTGDLITRVQQDGVRFISLQFTDILGTIKSVTIPVGRLEEVMERGIWFDGSSVEGFARIQESDRVLVLDPTTYHVLPWSAPGRRRARLICDVHLPDGQPSFGTPRQALKRLLAQAAGRGKHGVNGPRVQGKALTAHGKIDFRGGKLFTELAAGLT